MKNNVALLGVLAGFVGFALIGMFSAGEQHVVVVEEKENLTIENKKLVCANDCLKKENQTLTNKNLELNSQVAKMSESLALNEQEAKRKDLKNSEFLIALYSLEKIVKNELDWISPEALYQSLYEKMNRKPTEAEYQDALKDMQKLGLLYHYVKPDPYMKGDKVKPFEIQSLSKKLGE
jgi:uncharacterized protein YneF (UPF0154 family)